MAKKEADKVEYQKRIYAVSLLLRRKPTSFIVEFIIDKWKVSKAQAYKYIRKARAEWKKYFEKLKGDGIAYHVTQNRDLKDKAMTDGDYKLAFDIAKEEAKLMGVYPAEKHEHTGAGGEPIRYIIEKTYEGEDGKPEDNPGETNP